MAGPAAPPQVCAYADCPGARLEGEHCLEHLSPSELDSAVTRLRAGDPLNARNTTISAGLLDLLLDALRINDKLVLPAADFRGATFSGDADFRGAMFSGDADFDATTFSGDTGFGQATFSADTSFAGATFSGTAGFVRATFSGDADFDGTTVSGAAGFVGTTFSGTARFGGATFSRDASFFGATFSGYANFVGATFSGRARFGRATFSGDAGFGGTTVIGDARFGRATFSGDARFGGATFSSDANFERATISGDARFGRATFSGAADFVRAAFSGDAAFDRATFRDDARFDRAIFNRSAHYTSATFERARTLGAMSIDQHLVLDDCVFLERVRLDVAARTLSARASTFAAGALLRVRWAEVALDNADFARPSTLSAATSWDEEDDLQPICLVDDRHVKLDPRPRLVTVRGAHVAALSVSNVDLRACRFFGAHGLESMTLEASCQWPRTPPGRRHADRETIAEEHPWRNWDDPHTKPPAWLEGRDGTDPLTATQIAGLYRALRKAREDDKDQAGAGDLYYGEMEMRRHAIRITRGRLPASGDRAILRLYWLISGYGLRPGRALVALAVTLLIAAALLQQFGFHDPRSYGRSLLFSIESSVSLLRPPETKLSAGGEIIQITLRLLGPLLVGLALLAIRTRVKR
jgi:hypothetical protein